MSEHAGDVRHFAYGQDAIDYLCSRDPKLAEVIGQVGHVYRVVENDLFACVIKNIVGQQISGKALETIWGRILGALGEVTPETVSGASVEELQSLGMSFRKAEYAHGFAASVAAGTFDLGAVRNMPDEEAIAALTTVRGIGRWTAEMILLFCLQRPDILAFDDLGIQRGMRMVYHHRKITKKLFEKYRRRYSPYGSVASLYLWEVSGGRLPGYRDYAPKRKR